MKAYHDIKSKNAIMLIFLQIKMVKTTCLKNIIGTSFPKNIFFTFIYFQAHFIKEIDKAICI